VIAARKEVAVLKTVRTTNVVNLNMADPTNSLRRLLRFPFMHPVYNVMARSFGKFVPLNHWFNNEEWT